MSATRDVRFVSEDDRGYQAYRRRAVERRAAMALSGWSPQPHGLIQLRTLWPGQCGLTCAPSSSFAAGNTVSREHVSREHVSRHHSVDPPSATRVALCDRIDIRLSCSAIGRRVERAVRLWLGLRVKLERDRILTWQQRLEEGGFARRYRELDGVWRSDYDAVCLYEIKFTSVELMAQGRGAAQLRRATETLLAGKATRKVRRRLVYVGDAVDRLLVGGESAAPDDDTAPAGIVWVTPEEVEAAASSLGEPLPAYWYDKRSLDRIPDSLFALEATDGAIA